MPVSASLNTLGCDPQLDCTDIYLEILGQTAYDNAIMFTLCTPLSIVFLIYSYAIMMNGKAAE